MGNNGGVQTLHRDLVVRAAVAGAQETRGHQAEAEHAVPQDQRAVRVSPRKRGRAGRV